MKTLADGTVARKRDLAALAAWRMTKTPQLFRRYRRLIEYAKYKFRNR